MRDYSSMYEQFSVFVNLVEAQGRIPTESDIEYFAERFLTDAFGFLYPEGSGGVYIYSANYNNKETGQKLMDTSGESFKDLFKEVLPLLKAKASEVYDGLGSVEEAYNWNPEPIDEMTLAKRYAMDSMGVNEWERLPGTEKRNHPAFIKAVSELTRKKSRIKEYNKEVIPFILRKTMYHPLAAGFYSTTSGQAKVVRNAGGKPFSINSEEELQDYLSSSTVAGFPAALHDGLRYIWFQPSPSGKNIKMAVVDIDNPAGISDKDIRKVVRFVVKTLTDNDYPNIVMFTGNSYQVWFGAKEGDSLGSIQNARDLVKSLLYNPEIIAFKRNTAIDNKVAHIDDSVLFPNQPVRMFFNLHYPTGTEPTKTFTGLAAIPIVPGDIERFDPLVDAHPERVLINFKRYAAIVSMFFDTVKIGQDYEDEGEIETTPPCNRHETKDKENKLLDNLSEEDMIVVPSDQISGLLSDEQNLICYVQERGVPAVLHYKATGNIRIGGKVLSSIRKRQVRKAIKVETEQVKAVLLTKSGTVVYDDFICRDIERYCRAKGITTLTLVGTVVKRDILGNNLGSQEVRSILQSKEGIDPARARLLTFVPHELVDFNGSTSKLPLTDRLEEIGKISTSRITPTLFYPELKSPVVSKVKKLFKDLLRQRKVGSLIAVGDEKYKITSKRTILATIVGIDKTSSAFKTDSKSIGPVFIAVTKRHSKFGPVYMIVAKADIALPKEQREQLKQRVLGEKVQKENREGDIIEFFSNVLPLSARTDTLADQIQILEPTVVVEVQYDDIGPMYMNTLPFHYRKTDRGVFYRGIATKQYATPILGARVSAIRTDLSAKRTGDIDISQDPLLDVKSSAPKGFSLLDALPNPRNNPAFFGVPASRKIKIGGTYSEHWYDPRTKTWYSGVEGGREARVDLLNDTKKVPGEFSKAFRRQKRGEDGFKVFVDGTSKTTFGSAEPYYSITGMGNFFQTAVDDTYGMGQDGFRVTSMDGGIKDVKSYADQMTMHQQHNQAQSIEDSKILATQVGMVPGDPNAENQGFGTYRSYDQNYVQSVRDLDKKLDSAMAKKGMLKDDIKKMLGSKGIATNPPIKQDSWQSRVSDYASEYEVWKDSPDPKEPWGMVSQTKFQSWELPILEKQRLLREATGAYALTELELDAINSRFGEPMSGDLLESVLSDLYSEEEQAEIEEVEEDDGASAEDN